MPPSTSPRTDRAVSPVVGVILMVGITVILAATVGAFVFGLAGSTPNPAPTVVLEAEYDSSTNPSGTGNEVHFTVQSADSVPTSELSLRLENAQIVPTSGSRDPAHLTGNPLSPAGTELTAGDRFDVNQNTVVDPSGNTPTNTEYLDLSDATITLSWSNGDNSAVLYTWTAP